MRAGWARLAPSGRPGLVSIRRLLTFADMVLILDTMGEGTKGAGDLTLLLVGRAGGFQQSTRQFLCQGQSDSAHSATDIRSPPPGSTGQIRAHKICNSSTKQVSSG